MFWNSFYRSYANTINKIICSYNSLIFMKNTVNRENNWQNPEPVQSLPNLDLIENEVERRLTNPEESSYCTCAICMTRYEVKEKNKAFLKQTSSSMKIQPSKMQQFLNLVSAVSSRVYYKLDIPQICFFHKGNPKKLYRSNNTGVHLVELTGTVIKNLADIFLEDRKLNTTIKSETDDSLMELIGRKQDTHIKNLPAVIPSFKHGEHIEPNKPLTFYFHNNSNDEDYSGVIMGQLLPQEICIIKSKEKGFQLINQKQLRKLLKSLLSLQGVQYIQTFIKPNEKSDKIIGANYSNKKGTSNALMYERSLIQIKIEINLANKFSNDYIPLEQLENYQNFLKQTQQDYCLYQTYKMVHYMELIKDVTIQKLGTLWLESDEEELCFFGLSDFAWSQNEKLNVNSVQIEQLKDILSSQMTDFQQQLLNAWQSMKRRKMRVDQKMDMDEIKRRKLEQIKRESELRIAKQKAKQKEKEKATRNSIKKSSINNSAYSYR